MTYVKTTWEYAGIIEVHKHHSSRYGDHRGRAAKSKKTGEREKAANEKRRREQLFRILAANFAEGDAHATLTYREDAPDEKKAMKTFVRKMRRELEKRGQEFRYVYVTEKTKKGKPHHHMVMNVTSTALIRRMWTEGGVKISPLFPDKDYEQLADYMLKDEGEKGKPRYTASRNLIIPKPKREVIKASDWKKDPEPKKGYWIPKDSVVVGINADGYPYQRYKMVSVEQMAGSQWKKRKAMEKMAEGYITGKWWKRTQ